MRQQVYIYIILSIILLSCNDDKDPIPEEPIGQVNLSLISEKEIAGKTFDLQILDNNGSTIESITNISETPEYIGLGDGSYRISLSSQNQDFTTFGDLVFNGISDLFEISRSDTLEISISLDFDKPLGKIKIELSGSDIDDAFFSLITLDSDSNVLETQTGINEIPPYLTLETGSYQYAIQSSSRSYTTVEDLVFSGYSKGFSIGEGDTLTLSIDVSLADRKGWIGVPNVPMTERFASSSFIIDNNIYIGFGSSFSNERFQDWWVYSIENNSWRQLDDFPDGKRFASLSFSIGTKGYICLGLDEFTTTLTELWEFDTETESWTKLSDFPGVSRSNATVFVIDDSAYIGSGIANGTTSLKDFHVYDATNNSWSTISAYGGAATYGFTSFVIDDSGYLVGGVINNAERTSRHITFNSSSEDWDELPSFPGTERLDGIGFTIDGKGYFGLGNIDNSTAGIDLWVYDATDSQWIEVDSFVGEPRFSTIHGSNGSLGYFGFGEKGNKEYNDLYLYYPTD